MKKQTFLKFLTLVFTLTILATLAINSYAVIDDSPYFYSTNVPDRSVDRRDSPSTHDRSARTGTASDTGTIPEESNVDESGDQTGVLDEALTKADEAIDDVTGAIGDMKDDVDNAVDDMDNGNGFMGVVLAILIAVAIIILIIVMVSKNTGKRNR